jgi:hypothetical protein
MLEILNAMVRVLHRWGWIANMTGSELLLRVDTRSGDSSRASKAGVKNEVLLTFLHSYERMGKAKVECVNNCK